MQETLFKSQQINKGKSGSYFYSLPVFNAITLVLQQSKFEFVSKPNSKFYFYNNTESIITLNRK
jgi:hypothetical protein